jgi:hypothetical protein
VQTMATLITDAKDAEQNERGAEHQANALHSGHISAFASTPESPPPPQAPSLSGGSPAGNVEEGHSLTNRLAPVVCPRVNGVNTWRWFGFRPVQWVTTPTPGTMPVPCTGAYQSERFRMPYKQEVGGSIPSPPISDRAKSRLPSTGARTLLVGFGQIRSQGARVDPVTRDVSDSLALRAVSDPWLLKGAWAFVDEAWSA